jgi:uncharacterized protein (TIGR02594 family)
MTLYDFAQRFVGLAEVSGPKSNGFVSWAHSLCGLAADTPDEVPWCSSFMNALAWMLRLPRSKSAAARSWLEVGTPIEVADARPGFDVVILKRGAGPQPGPEITRGASGHVGLFAGVDQSFVLVLGGNQGNAVSIARFPIASVLGVRRLS